VVSITKPEIARPPRSWARKLSAPVPRGESTSTRCRPISLSASITTTASFAPGVYSMNTRSSFSA
jgi:hypothetical protein